MCYLCMQAACDGREDLLDDFLELCTKGQININALVKHHRVNIIQKLLAKYGTLALTVLYIHLGIR